MKYYIVERDAKSVGWDEFDSLVVRAHNKAEALALAVDFYSYFAEHTTTVTAIQRTTKAKIVHTSFCAG